MTIAAIVPPGGTAGVPPASKQAKCQTTDERAAWQPPRPQKGVLPFSWGCRRRRHHRRPHQHRRRPAHCRCRPTTSVLPVASSRVTEAARLTRHHGSGCPRSRGVFRDVFNIWWCYPERCQPRRWVFLIILPSCDVRRPSTVCGTSWTSVSSPISFWLKRSYLTWIMGAFLWFRTCMGLSTMISCISRRVGLCRSIIPGQAEVPSVPDARAHHHHVPAPHERHLLLWLRPAHMHCVPGRMQDVQRARPQRGHASRQDSERITPANRICLR